MINKLAKEVHENAIGKGFYEGKKNTGEMIALIHSEVSEALEADRKDFYVSRGSIKGIVREKSPSLFKAIFRQNFKDTFEDELADIMIRVMDLAAFKGVDLESHIQAKMRFNELRPHKHGKKY